MESLHDYNIYKYEVYSSSKEIILHTKEHHGKKEAVVTFSGVTGHLLEHALEGNIILDFEEHGDLSVFYKRASSDLQRYQKYGLPLKTNTEQEFISSMQGANLKAYEISSSYGLTGWVLATEVTTRYNQ
jgi:hypothetical protein